jgi:hypothetical protein
MLRKTALTARISVPGPARSLRVLERRNGWRRVATGFGATGWVPARDLCG